VLLRKLFVLVFFFAASLAGAVEVSVTVSDLTAQQEARLASVLADVNASRANAGLTPFADFNAYARWVVIQSTLDYIQKQNEEEAAAAAQAVLDHGDETAAAGQCTAAGLSAGCRKGQVACYVLTGSTDCQ
jgi:hypothetical protein